MPRRIGVLHLRQTPTLAVTKTGRVRHAVVANRVPTLCSFRVLHAATCPVAGTVELAGAWVVGLTKIRTVGLVPPGYWTAHAKLAGDVACITAERVAKATLVTAVSVGTVPTPAFSGRVTLRAIFQVGGRRAGGAALGLWRCATCARCSAGVAGRPSCGRPRVAGHVSGCDATTAARGDTCHVCPGAVGCRHGGHGPTARASGLTRRATGTRG